MSNYHRLLNTIPSSPLLQRNVQFIRAAWQAGLRADQRHASQLREMEVTFPHHKREVVEVQLGNTKVMAGVEVELVEPLPFRPQHGFFHIRVRQCMHDRDGSRTIAQIKRTTRYLERLLKGNVLDNESLCVLAGRCVWALKLEVIIMNDDGNVCDVAAWASLCALQHFRRPELTIRGEEVTLHPPHERDPVPLLLHYLPLSFTFAITRSMSELQLEQRVKQALGVVGTSSTAFTSQHLSDSGSKELIIIVDPTKEETAAAATVLTVAITVEGQVCAIEKREGCEVTLPMVQECLRLASQLAKEVSSVIESAMSEHEERRRTATQGQFLWAQSRVGVQSADANTALKTTQIEATEVNIALSESSSEEKESPIKDQTFTSTSKFVNTLDIQIKEGKHNEE